MAEHRLLGSRLGTGIVEPQWLFTTAKTDVKYKITSDFSSLYSFCLAGAGVALLPYGIVSKDVKNGQLVNILPELETEETDVYLVYASRKHMTSSAKLFIEHIQQALTDLKRLNELEKNRKY